MSWIISPLLDLPDLSYLDREFATRGDSILKPLKVHSPSSDNLMLVECPFADASPVKAIAFQATLEHVDLGRCRALASVDGLVLDASAEGDVFLRVFRPRNRATACRPLDLAVGIQATELIGRGVDVELFTTTRRLVALFDAYIHYPDARWRPGTRLLACMASKHASERTQVVADFLSDGDDVEDRASFLGYFFPDLSSVGLEIGRANALLWAFGDPRHSSN